MVKDMARDSATPQAGPVSKARLWANWLGSLAAGLAVAALAARAGMPVAWLIGPILSGLALAIFSGPRAALPKVVPDFAQILLAVTVGLAFSKDTFLVLGGSLPFLLVYIVLTTVLSLFNGYLLTRLTTSVDRASGFLGCLPGGAAVIVAFSDQLGADGRVVAVLQYVRVLLILFVTPLGIRFLAHTLHQGAAATLPASAVPTDAATFRLVHFLVLLALGLAGRSLAARFRLPSPSFTGAFMVTIAAAWTVFPPLQMPDFIFNGSLVLLGTSIGVGFDWPTLRKMGPAAAIEVGLVVILIAVSGLLALGFHWLTGVDVMTSILGTVPGGKEGMMAMAYDLRADASMVAAMQIIRFTSMILMGPWITRWLQNQFLRRK